MPNLTPEAALKKINTLKSTEQSLRMESARLEERGSAIKERLTELDGLLKSAGYENLTEAAEAMQSLVTEIETSLDHLEDLLGIAK